MRLFKWLIILLIVTFIGSILHYTLPQRDVVRILDAYEKRMDVAANSFFWAQADAGTVTTDTRDVRFIDTIRPDGSVMVYRNEDTGFGWQLADHAKRSVCERRSQDSPLRPRTGRYHPLRGQLQKRSTRTQRGPVFRAVHNQPWWMISGLHNGVPGRGQKRSQMPVPEEKTNRLLVQREEKGVMQLQMHQTQRRPSRISFFGPYSLILALWHQAMPDQIRLLPITCRNAPSAVPGHGCHSADVGSAISRPVGIMDAAAPDVRPMVHGSNGQDTIGILSKTNVIHRLWDVCFCGGMLPSWPASTHTHPTFR